MKKSNVLLALFLLFSILVHSQEEWVSLPVNPNMPSGSPYDIEMVDGKIYQYYNFFSGSQYRTQTDVFNHQTLTWDFVEFAVSTQLTKLITQKIGNTVYMVGYDGSAFSFSKYPGGTGSVPVVQDYVVSGVNNNWEFETGTGDEELYILYTIGTGPSDVFGLERNPGFTWNSMTESSSQDLSVADLQIQATSDKVFFGVFSNKIRMTYFFKGSITTMFAYDGALGEVFSDGLNWDNPGFLLVGNKNDYEAFYATEDANNLSYEVPVVPGSQINVNTASDPTTGFNLDPSILAKESSPSHGFIASVFSTDGIGNPNNKSRVIRRDFTQGGSTWQTVGGGVFVPNGTTMNANSFKLSINNNYNHIAVAYNIQGQPNNDIKISNDIPYLLAGTDQPGSGLCAGQINEIYSGIEFMDDNYDKIVITSATSLNGFTSGITVIPFGFQNGITKFKILGLPTGGVDQIVLQYTDGFNSYSTTLPSYNPITNPQNVQFVSDPVLFCENEVQVDLSQFVNYYDQGSFKLNGQTINGTQINAYELNNISPVGVVRLIQNIDGCIITTTANYQVIAAPTVSISTTPTSCSQNSGSATATVTPGLSSNLTKYWSTGETTSTINNLEAGAYYFLVIDDNNCKANALASVIANDITVTATVTDPSCFGSNDGGVQLTVTGSSNYQIVWSNGYFGQNLSNVGAGNYEYTLYDASGCEIKEGFDLVSPSKIDFNFTTTNPDCGVSNGKIFTNLTGGTAPYNRSWSNGATTNNLTGLDPGLFILTVTDGNNCVFKDSLFLTNDNPVQIVDSIFPSDCGTANGGISLSIVETPQSGPVNSILWDNGSTQEDIFDLYGGQYLLTVNYGANCILQKSFQVGIKPPLRNDICVVTVDDQTTTNLVVWEKLESEGISYFNIYREDAIAGDYIWIDTVHFTNLSVFNDVIASPLHRSWRYRISSVNLCGVESALSIPHKTLHLNTIEQTTPGTFDIYWDNYEGISDGTYIVNRFTDQNGWEALSPTVPFGAPTVFTDTPPVNATGLDYFVSFALAVPCTATYRAQDFNVSKSNKDRGIFNPGEGTGNSNNAAIEMVTKESVVSVFPNPFEDKLVVELKGENAEVKLFDIHGKLVSQQLCSEGSNEIKTSSLHEGLFFIQIKQGKETKTYKLSKL